MGWDIDIYCDVLVKSSECIPRLLLQLNRSDLFFAKESLLADDDFCEQLTEYGYKAWLPMDGGQYERIGDAKSLLNEVDSRFAFQEWLFRVYRAFVGSEDEEFVQQPIRVIAQTASIELPSFCLVTFDRERHKGRLSGLWHVEYDEVYFAFDQDECFRRILRPAGQQLQYVLNEKIAVTEWSSFSY